MELYRASKSFFSAERAPTVKIAFPKPLLARVSLAVIKHKLLSFLAQLAWLAVQYSAKWLWQVAAAYQQ